MLHGHFSVVDLPCTRALGELVRADTAELFSNSPIRPAADVVADVTATTILREAEILVFIFDPIQKMWKATLSI